ncbi:lipopolysaccharide transport periplasmic protein LptA [Chachezhania antarctica]|uniref:lipopolysaccharide transport periplasmic protein LptA n=1 Tax=Chachezhania antarctica TaxID=2340860 RepID=UPI001F094D03|nr:lipopolysaccharide transport periplasmic protein LptA [Chachezhania antarctica]
MKTNNDRARSGRWDSGLVALCLSLCLCLSPVAATAQSMAFGSAPTTQDQPVDITADTLDIDQNTGRAVFSGNVLVIQGDMRLSAKEVEVTYSEARSEIERVEATGDVVLVSGPDEAESQKAVYTPESGMVTMTGDVLLTQGQNAVTSQEMTVDLVKGTAQLSGRVRTILNPQQER